MVKTTEAMISITFFTLAAICNAVMDVIKHNWGNSIFIRIRNQFLWEFFHKNGWALKYKSSHIRRGIMGVWYDEPGLFFQPERKKWNLVIVKINKPVQLCDAWHFFKMWMVIFLAVSVITFPWSFSICIGHTSMNLLVWMIIYGFAWNLPFNLFYNKLLIKTK